MADQAPAAAPRHHWFRCSRARISLRALFAITALAGAWLAWNICRVQEHNRIAVLLSHANGTQDTVLVAAWSGDCERGWKLEARNRLPVIWRLLGALPVEQITLDKDEYTELDHSYYSQLFPEARVYLEDVQP